MKLAVIALSLTALSLQAATIGPATPIVDNERVTIWDVTWAKGTVSPIQQHDHDLVAIWITDGAVEIKHADGKSSVIDHKAGEFLFEPKGAILSEHAGATSPRTVLIELKDHVVPPLANNSGYQEAFPRPGSKKVFQNARVTMWDYTWHQDVPTPMHFHSKDAVVTYLQSGVIRSSPLKGEAVLNPNSIGYAKFSPRDRTHTEEVLDGTDRAIITELN